MEINEKTFCVIPVSFEDENENPVIPVNVTTRIDDARSGINIRPVTPLVVTSPNVNILVTSNENRIVNPRNERREEHEGGNVGEIHLLTIQCDIPNGHTTGQYEIYIRNLKEITSP